MYLIEKSINESSVGLLVAEATNSGAMSVDAVNAESAKSSWSLVEGMLHYLSPGHLLEHVNDSTYFEVPKFLGGKIQIPNILGVTDAAPLWQMKGMTIVNGRLTKFMVLELIAVVLLIVVFGWLARRVRTGERPVGKAWNLLETFVVFIRDEIARPAIGSKDTNRFLPFLLTMFFFVLTLNLIGMVPMMGGATGSIAVTLAFALLTFVVVVGSGMKKMGVVGFLKAQVPHIDLPPVLAVVLIPGIWLIEMFGLLVKHMVLAIRLFANMFAGHLVLAVFVGFIGVAWTSGWVFYGIAPVSFLAALGLSLLELFVAFLQAYLFTFLSALFIGSAQHAH